MRLLFPGEMVRVCGWETLLKVREEGAEVTPRAILPQQEKMGDSLAEQAQGQASRGWQEDFPLTAHGFFITNTLKTRIGKTKRTGENFAIILITLTEQNCAFHLKNDFVIIFIQLKQRLKFGASWYLWWIT